MDADLIAGELDRLSASAPFRRAHRHLRFLRHLVALSRSGDSAGLREMALGVAVFHRPPDRFDPRSDSIVRVEARRLRQKLAAYYAGEGQAARLRFELAVGSYHVDIQPMPPGSPPASPASPASVHATPEAVHLGRAALGMGTLDACRRAVELADEALAQAPDLGSAWLMKAAALVAAVGMTALPAPGAMPGARTAALRALQDPRLTPAEQAEAHGLLALIAFSHDRAWPEALDRVRRAQALAPSATLHAREGWMLMFAGRFDAARRAYAAARAFDPVSLQYRAHEGLVELYARRFDLARTAFDDVLSVSPGHAVAQSLAAALHLYTGRVAEGLRAYQALDERLPGLTIGLCGAAQALALAGDRDAAEAAFARLVTRFEAGQAPPYQLAMVRCRLGDAAGALHWLDRAAALHDFNLVCAGVDPAFDSQRADAMFCERLKTWGLAL